MTTYRIDVNIVDDHTMLNEGLTEALNHNAKIHVSRSFSTLAECRDALRVRQPDVLLLDISMPDGDGVDFCQWLVSEYPKIKIIAITIHDEYSIIHRMLEAGVNGYVLKSASLEELVGAICSVWKGQKYISPQVADILHEGSAKSVVLTNVEQNILRLICDGQTNPQIARQLSLSDETIKWYRKRLLAKFGVRNTVNLVTLVMKENIIRL